MSPIELLGAELADLTQYELASRGARYDLTHAMNARRMSADYPAVVARLPELWLEAENTGQVEAEELFLDRFFAFLGRAKAGERHNSMLVYSASVAVSIVSTYLLQKGMSVDLVTPCIDNLPGIMKQMGVPVRAVPEECPLGYCRGDALFLVDPSNPTGRTMLNDGTLKTVIEFALAHDKLLIFDFSFAPFLERGRPVDVYEALERSGVRYIAIEDTGKVWPSQALKASVIKCSRGLKNDLFNIKTGVLLNVSSFSLLLLVELMEATEKGGFAYFRDLKGHHHMIEKAFAGTPLRYLKPDAAVPVAWCAIDELGLGAEEFCARLGLEDVCVLPGDRFYWDGAKPPGQFIRISLARETSLIREALLKMRELALVPAAAL